MINIEIDGKKLQVAPGVMIIEAADDAGIPIPRFCYHKKLSIAANCRMCLIEVEKSRKPLPACATPVTEGMKVFTKSALARDAQQSVMEFLLINHPLDCPICDQGGECELQDVSMGYGADISRFSEQKRAVEDENLGSLIATEMTRCIQCTRCVRFGEEVAGMRELGATGRGEHTEIETFINQNLASELSGNIIDLCPVGALTSRPYRFTARAWELLQFPTIAPHDCTGAHLSVHTRNNEVMRVVPRECESINETWASDRDRFSYTALQSNERVLHPMIKHDGQWQQVTYPEAFEVVVKKIKQLLQIHGKEECAALISPSATLEELYLWQKLWRAFGVDNIDHRLRTSDFSKDADMPAYPGLSCAIAALDEQDHIFLIGGNVRKEQPLLAQRIRKATLQGAQVIALNVIDYEWNFNLADQIIVHPEQWLPELASVLAAVMQRLETTVAQKIAQFDDHDLMNYVRTLKPTAQHQRIAQQWCNGSKRTILFGAAAMQHEQYSQLLSCARAFHLLLDAQVGLLTPGANTAGAWLSGALPHRLPGGKAAHKAGRDAQTLLAKTRSIYCLFQVEPELDAINSGLAKKSLHEADFIVAFNTFLSEGLKNYADVIFPVAPFTEIAGTFVNVNGHAQSFMPAATPKEEAKPGWKLLRVLANFMELDGFDFNDFSELQAQVQQEVGVIAPFNPKELPRFSQPTAMHVVDSGLTRITDWPIYSIDGFTRQAQPLQEAKGQDAITVKLHPQTAAACGVLECQHVAVSQGHAYVECPLELTERVAPDCVWIPAGSALTSVLYDGAMSVVVHPIGGADAAKGHKKVSTGNAHAK